METRQTTLKQATVRNMEERERERERAVTGETQVPWKLE
jgi:hypothetical protein